MSETLTTPRPRAEAPDPSDTAASERAPDALDNLEEELAKLDADRLESTRDRVADIINSRKSSGDSLDDTLVMDRPDDPDTFTMREPSPEAVARSYEQQEDTRGRLRKIGDAALSGMEKWAKSTPGQYIARKLELWGITPLRGTWHKQKGMNVSAWIARKYVAAQHNRHERLKAGFLSAEQNADISDEEPEETTERSDSPEKPEKKTPEKTESKSEEKAETKERPEEELIELPRSDDPERTEDEAEKRPGETRETIEAERASPETETARSREEAHHRAEAASARKAERKERRPIKEHAANLMQRLKGLKGKIGSAAMKFIRRAKASANAARDAWKASAGE